MNELTPQRFRALTKDKIKAIDNSEDLVQLIKEMRYLVTSQAKKIYKRGYNPIAFENLYTKSNSTLTGTISSNPTTQRQIAIQLLETYKSRTMTIKGAEEAARKEDIRLFGYEYFQTRTGLHYKKIKYRLTPSQRQSFWAVYNQIKEESPVVNSNLIQQVMEQKIVERVRDGEQDFAFVMRQLHNTYGFDRTFIDEVVDALQKEMEFDYS